MNEHTTKDQRKFADEWVSLTLGLVERMEQLPKGQITSDLEAQLFSQIAVIKQASKERGLLCTLGVKANLSQGTYDFAALKQGINAAYSCYINGVEINH